MGLTVEPLPVNRKIEWRLVEEEEAVDYFQLRFRYIRGKPAKGEQSERK
jgi:hypothetical protein